MKGSPPHGTAAPLGLEHRARDREESGGVMFRSRGNCKTCGVYSNELCPHEDCDECDPQRWCPGCGHEFCRSVFTSHHHAPMNRSEARKYTERIRGMPTADLLAEMYREHHARQYDKGLLILSELDSRDLSWG
jgi:hypothetical protein